MRKLILLVFSVAVLTFSNCMAKDVVSSEPTAKVSTYLQTAYMPVKKVSSKLESAGFEVLATFKSVKKGKTVIFTCPTLKKQAAKPNRAFVAVMRAFVDEEAQTLSIMNPVYFAKAYMQDDYEYAPFKKVKSKLETAFKGLKGGEDSMDYDDLAGFHFTLGMPYYEDTEVLGKATNKELLAKLKNYKKGKGLVFELKIDSDTTLVGYKIGRGTQRFTKKIGRANAGLLPWMISIDSGKAQMLKAEYYIALTYPQLGMVEFATIASVPGDVIKDLKKPFKK